MSIAIHALPVIVLCFLAGVSFQLGLKVINWIDPPIQEVVMIHKGDCDLAKTIAGEVKP